MHARNLELRHAAANHDWRVFVAQHCTSTVTDLDAIIPPEAPSTPTTPHVHVAGTLHTRCATGTPPVPDEPATATITMIHTDQGWLVDQRLY